MGKNHLSFPRHGGSRIAANGPRITVRVHNVAAVGDPSNVAREVIVECDGETRSRVYATPGEVRSFLDGVAALGACINAAMCDTANHETPAKQWHDLRVLQSKMGSAPAPLVVPPGAR